MNRSLLFASCAALLLAIASGCATKAQLLRRASFDLSCPEASIQITKIDDRTMGVSACGKQATYVEQCATQSQVGMATFQDDCSWVRN